MRSAILVMASPCRRSFVISPPVCNALGKLTGTRPHTLALVEICPPVRSIAPGALLRQNLVNQLDADGTLADGRRNALGASSAHVSNGENAGPVRLEEEGWTAQRPLY
jgi:hypothetical protein